MAESESGSKENGGCSGRGGRLRCGHCDRGSPLSSTPGIQVPHLSVDPPPTRPSLDPPRLRKENSTQQHSSSRRAHPPHRWHALTVRPHVRREPPPELSFRPPPIPLPTSRSHADPFSHLWHRSPSPNPALSHMFTLSPTQMLSDLMLHKIALSLTRTRTHSRSSPTLNCSHVLALTNPRDPTGTRIRFLSYTDQLSHPPTCSLIDIHPPSLIHPLSLIPALCHIHPPLLHSPAWVALEVARCAAL